MRTHTGFGKKFMLTAMLLMITLAPSFAKAIEDYKFKVHNNTSVAIKQVLVSEDGKKWGFFDIGKGIPAKATVDLVWAATTNSAGCEWYFKAVWADGDESDPSAFDFCEKGLVIEFSK